jgi:GNAT superfamily N-acetyltransferase
MSRRRSRISRRCPSAEIAIRALEVDDLETLSHALPVWSATEYAKRLQAQRRLQMVQAVAWVGATPVGRGMVLFAEHEEYSTSAARERCAEVRDVSVLEGVRRRGVATAVMRFLQDAAREAGYRRIGLSVGLDDPAEAARALYERLGYAHAHGPFIASTMLEGDGSPFPVGAVLTYLARDL